MNWLDAQNNVELGLAGDGSLGDGMGSWLSKAFKKVTGQPLSTFTASVAPIAAGFIPGVGAVAAPIVAAVTTPQAAQAAQAQGAPPAVVLQPPPGARVDSGGGGSGGSGGGLFAGGNQTLLLLGGLGLVALLVLRK